MRYPTMLLFLGAALVACGGDKDDTDTDGDTDGDTDFNAGDADADADADSDADADADADSDADADADSDTDSDADTDPTTGMTGDTGPVGPMNLLVNGDFELDNGGTPPQPTDWLVFPSGLTNFEVARTGDPIYGSAATFTANGGTGSMKMFGQFTGSENITPVYQEFNPAVAGDTYEFSGWAYTHTDDHVRGTTTAYLSIKYFDSYFNFFGADNSAVIDRTSAGSTWIQLTASGTVPAGATIVQASVEYAHCLGDFSGTCFDGGSVYIDDLTFVRTGP